MSELHGLVPLTISSAAVFGIVLALLGSIKLSLAKWAGIDEVKVGALLAALNLAFIPMMLCSGFLIDVAGVRWIVAAGSIITSLGLFCLGRARGFPSVFWSVLLTGAGGACLTTGSAVLMPAAFFAERYPAAAVNLGSIFFGLGALLTPPVADMLVRQVGFRRGLSLLSVVCLVPALAAMATSGAAFPAMEEQLPMAPRAVLSNPIIWITGLVALLYNPLEGAVSTWATSYLTDFGYTQRRAAWLLSGFWLAYIGALGRVVPAAAGSVAAPLGGLVHTGARAGFSRPDREPGRNALPDLRRDRSLWGRSRIRPHLPNLDRRAFQQRGPLHARNSVRRHVRPGRHGQLDHSPAHGLLCSALFHPHRSAHPNHRRAPPGGCRHRIGSFGRLTHSPPATSEPRPRAGSGFCQIAGRHRVGNLAHRDNSRHAIATIPVPVCRFAAWLVTFAFLNVRIQRGVPLLSLTAGSGFLSDCPPPPHWQPGTS